MHIKWTALLAAVIILCAVLLIFPTHKFLADAGLTLTVNANTDAVDALPGDGVCETATGNAICTLRAAVLEANAHLGADTIILPTGTYTLTIGGSDEEQSATGDLDITNALTISGNSAQDTILTAEGLGDRVIDIKDSATEVTISGVMIVGGLTNENGGGIKSAAHLKLSNSSVLHSQAAFGGGIYSLAQVDLYNDIIMLNTAYSAGGGIYADHLVMDTSAINTNSSASGGGIYLADNSTARIDNSIIRWNSANDGGGIYLVSGELDMVSVHLGANESANEGGAIFNATDGRITTSRAIVDNNSSDFLGGGIFNQGRITMDGSMIVGNQANSGGGVYADLNGSVFLSNMSIGSNTAVGGGGISNAAQLEIRSSEIYSNTAPEGAGIYNYGQLNLFDVSISSNTGNGLLNHGSIIGESVRIKTNTDSGLIIPEGTVDLTNSIIAGNQGGGIRCSTWLYTQCHLNLKDSTISGNHASANGGGLFNQGTVLIESSTISENLSGLNGGGIYNEANLSIENSTINGNTAFQDGGGIYDAGNVSTYIFNSTVTDNTSSFTGQEGYLGGGIYIETNVYIANSIVYGNHRMVGPAPIDADCSGMLNSLHYNLVGVLENCTLANSQGFDLVGVDPKLGALEDNGGPTQTNALLDGSPAIDAANPGGCTDNSTYLLIHDQRGYLRHWDGDGDGIARCDIGAFEYGSVAQIFLPIAIK